MSFAERVYRAALAAYPAACRAERGEEVLGTMLEATEGRRLPDMREVGSIIADGIRRSVGTAPWGAYRSAAPWAAHAVAILTAAVAVLGLIREDHLAGSLPPSLGRELHAFGLTIDPWFGAFGLARRAASRS